MHSLNFDKNKRKVSKTYQVCSKSLEQWETLSCLCGLGNWKLKNGNKSSCPNSLSGGLDN